MATHLYNQNKVIVIILFFSLQVNLSAQTDPKIVFDNLISNNDVSKWPKPDSNNSTYITPCGSGQNSNSTIRISNFNPISSVVRVSLYPYRSNYLDSNFTRLLWSDIGTVDGGNKEYKIQYQHEHSVIPDRNGQSTVKVEDGGSTNIEFFEFKFDITNNTTNNQLYYVIFYQNESYYYCENSWNMLLSGDNYYGSWGEDEKLASGFRSKNIPVGTSARVSDIFRIRGNPRNNTIYVENPADIPGWRDSPSSDYLMNRWAEGPRMGKYRFLLVVTSDPNSITLPFLKDHSATYNGKYYSPFYWRNCLNSTYSNSTAVAEGCYYLKVFAEPDLNATLQPELINSSPFTNSSSHDWHSCLIEQVPLVVNFDDFTQLDYNFNKHFASTNTDLISIPIDFFNEKNINWAQEKGNAYPSNNPNNPNKIIIATPESNCEEGVFKREHAGINYTGLKYGKFTALVKFPGMYNPYDVWKGINNTFWMTQAHGRDKPYGQHDCPDQPEIGTEFDIEYFPKSSEAGNFDPNSGIGYYQYFADESNSVKQYNINDWNKEHKEAGRVAVLYSNFDYICMNVPHPIVVPPGQQMAKKTIQYSEGSSTYAVNLIRSGGSQNGVKSLFSQIDGEETEFEDDDIFEDHEFYYQFEWTPTELIFRRGTTLSNLKVVGYFNSNYTIIPKNYMSWIIAHHQLAIRYPGTYDCAEMPNITNNNNAHYHTFLPLSNTPFIGEVSQVKIE